MSSKKNSSKKEEADSGEKIRSLQEMIATAERTITSAKQMLSQMQESGGNSASNSPSLYPDSNGQVIMGTFDGQIMIGEDGKQYPVPANYASKSKLVEGDMLKLNITGEGTFVYKQIGPAERKFLIGLAKQDEKGNFIIKTEEKIYKVLLAAVTYFKIEPGDEVTIVVPKDKDSVWGAIENIVRKASEVDFSAEAKKAYDENEKVSNPDEKKAAPKNKTKSEKQPEEMPERPSAIEKLEQEMREERKKLAQGSVADEWMPDIEQLKKEAGHPVGAKEEE